MHRISIDTWEHYFGNLLAEEDSLEIWTIIKRTKQNIQEMTMKVFQILQGMKKGKAGGPGVYFDRACQ